MADKSFFRIRVKESCSYPTVMVKGLGKVTKAWQLKKGRASDYAVYPGLETQPMVKEGSIFVPDPNANFMKGGELNDTGESSDRSTVFESQNFVDMTVEQLKAFLIAKGVPASDIRGAVKADLLLRAESVWNSQTQASE
jgi:hypothetical protein